VYDVGMKSVTLVALCVGCVEEERKVRRPGEADADNQKRMLRNRPSTWDPANNSLVTG
jgi:hypothetical protein